MKVAFYTLGCKVNQYETSALAELFEKAGFEVNTKFGEADIFVVNSCTVTAGGDKKSLQWLRRARRENPAAVTVLTGCLPQTLTEQELAIEDADIITGTAERTLLVERVQNFIKNKTKAVYVKPYAKGQGFEQLEAQAAGEHTRAFLKVEDGCNRSCAYCIIPKARGPVRSMDMQNIKARLAAFAKSGFKEVVITGINLSFYGLGTAYTLADVAEAAQATEGIERIRLGSLEPDMLSDDTLQRLAALKKLMPHFHLSLQSGCDATLIRMNRHYTTAQYGDLLGKMRSLFSAPTFTTDVIVGFPLENEQEFAATCSFVASCAFTKVHIFNYSVRKGTAAADMPQLPQHVKIARHAQLELICNKTAETAIAATPQLEQVLIEKPLGLHSYTGYTQRYIKATVKSSGLLKSGQIANVKMLSSDGSGAVYETDSNI